MLIYTVSAIFYRYNAATIDVKHNSNRLTNITAKSKQKWLYLFILNKYILNNILSALLSLRQIPCIHLYSMQLATANSKS